MTDDRYHTKAEFDRIYKDELNNRLSAVQRLSLRQSEQRSYERALADQRYLQETYGNGTTRRHLTLVPQRGTA